MRTHHGHAPDRMTARRLLATLALAGMFLTSAMPLAPSAGAGSAFWSAMDTQVSHGATLGLAGAAVNVAMVGGGVGYAVCDPLSTACAAAAADVGEACAKAETDLSFFPGKTEVEACASWGGAACAGVALWLLLNADVACDAEVTAQHKGPGTKCRWWKPWTWGKCGDPKVVESTAVGACAVQRTLLVSGDTPPKFIGCGAWAHAVGDAMCFEARADAFAKSDVSTADTPEATATNCKGSTAGEAAADVESDPFLASGGHALWPPKHLAYADLTFTDWPDRPVVVTGVPTSALGSADWTSAVRRSIMADWSTGVDRFLAASSPTAEGGAGEPGAATMRELRRQLVEGMNESLAAGFDGEVQVLHLPEVPTTLARQGLIRSEAPLADAPGLPSNPVVQRAQAHLVYLRPGDTLTAWLTWSDTSGPQAVEANDLDLSVGTPAAPPVPLYPPADPAGAAAWAGAMAAGVLVRADCSNFAARSTTHPGSGPFGGREGVRFTAAQEAGWHPVYVNGFLVTADQPYALGLRVLDPAGRDVTPQAVDKGVQEHVFVRSSAHCQFPGP